MSTHTKTLEAETERSDKMYRILKVLIAPLIRLVWVRQVSGMERLPKEGSAIVALNHQSYFDFICFLAVSDRHVHFLAAEKFFESLIWAPIMRAMGQIRVNRTEHDKSEVNEKVRFHLERGDLIGIFPEGTRSKHEHHMLPAFTGVTKFAHKMKVPIIPVGIKGTYAVMARHHKIPRLKKVVSIHVGEPHSLHEHHDKDLSHDEHLVLTDVVMEKISKLSGKEYLKRNS